MKKFSLIVSLVLVAQAAIPAAAQYSGGAGRPATATRSVLKQADQVEWADYNVNTVAGPGISGCPDAHVTCSTGVCHGYDNCCCRPHLLCCLKKIGRMLDCLLPCNKCCPGGCLFGGCGCGPHLFHRGGCGGCGGCNIGCSTPSCSSPIGYPASDPFIDDPIPPRPMPEPAKDVRHRTPPSPYAARKVSPYKVTTSGEVTRQRAIEASRREVAPVAAPLTAPFNPRDKVAAQPRTHSRPAPRSILQPVTAEEDIEKEISTVEPARRDAAPATPALLPVTIQRTSAEVETDDLDIPVNPLRSM